MGVFKKFCDQNDIKILPTKSTLKASVVERFNRTLKEKIWRVFTHNSINKITFPQKYKNFLPLILNSYNNTWHRSIKTSPSKVNKSNEEEIYKNLYNDQIDTIISFKYKIGDYVRILEKKPLFSKGYTQNWSKDLFIIRNLVPSNPPRYLIKDFKSKNNPNKFYTEEIQKVFVNEFPFDTYRVLKEKDNRILVEKLNSDKEISWFDKQDFQND